jgi:uncharacterized protein (DUF111 family)
MMKVDGLLCTEMQGVELREVEQGLRSIPVVEGEWRISCRQVLRSKGGIAAKHLTVESKYKHRPAPVPQPVLAQTHAHDHAHNHNHNHNHNHSHSHDHHHGHAHSLDHDDLHDHSHDDHDQGPVRNYSTIVGMIDSSALPEQVKLQAKQAFLHLAEAEARVHGSTVEQVHFHEVGAVDSIIDTVGVLLALHLLGVSEVYCSNVPMSSGVVRGAHGIMPVPAPATLYLMQGMPLTAGPPG